MYKIISALLWLIRQFAIPNPFEVLGDGITIMLGETPFLLTPTILNWVAGLILPAITFGMVGIYYSKGSAPTLGSFLYMFLFCVNTGVLHLMCFVYPATWLIVLIGIGYIGLHGAIYSFINKNIL